MEKEFIPYEQALALKELGFVEKCLSYPMSNTDASGRTWTSVIVAPTFSQAFRFFREKYNLSGLIEIGTQEFSYQVFNNKGNRQLGNESMSYNGTYEEAELECLKKLIEIVKNK